MADRHPYVSSNKALTETINQLRKSFPRTIDANTLKKLGIAPNNESYIINIIRFLGLIDQDGSSTDLAHNVFSHHEDEKFQQEFSKVVRDAYSDLFDTRGEDAWTLDQASLIAYFRATDKTTAVVGTRQANTFMVLSGFCGKRELPSVRTSSGTGKATKTSKKTKATREGTSRHGSSKGSSEEAEAAHGPVGTSAVSQPTSAREVGLTVRIEVNLPSGADQETYDRIFRSIRENLINE
jgi:hypothetical protein